MLSKQKYYSKLLFIFYFILSIAIIYPYFHYHCIFIGDDSGFHLSRLNELIATPLGNFPIISTHTFGSTGNQVNVFYPSQFLYPLSILIKIFNHPIIIISIYLVILNLLTFYCSYWAAQRLKKPALFSIIFSLLYTGSTYHLINTYARFDLGETLATIFLPLVFSGFYLVLHLQGGRLLLTIGLLGLLFSHVLSLLTILITLAIWLACHLLVHQNPHKILVSLLQVGIACLGCGFSFWVPFVDHYLKTISGIQPTQIIFNILTPYKVSDQLNSIIHNQIYPPYTVGLTILILIVIITISFVIKHERINFNYWIILVLSWVTLIMTTELFPWFLFKNSFINIIQFPFRLNAPLTLGIAWCSACLPTLWCKRVKSKIIMSTCIILLVGLSSFNAIQQFTQMELSQNRVIKSDAEYYKFNPDYRWNSDYHPRKASQEIQNIAIDIMKINNKKYIIHGNAGTNAITYTFIAKKVPSYIDLPFLYYSNNYRVINFGKKIPYKFSSRGTFALHTNRSYNQINITYQPTLIDRFSWIISALSFILLGLLISNYKHVKIYLKT